MEYYRGNLLANAAWGGPARGRAVWDDVRKPVAHSARAGRPVSHLADAWTEQAIDVGGRPRAQRDRSRQTANQDGSGVNPLRHPHYMSSTWRSVARTAATRQARCFRAGTRSTTSGVQESSQHSTCRPGLYRRPSPGTYFSQLLPRVDAAGASGGEVARCRGRDGSAAIAQANAGTSVGVMPKSRPDMTPPRRSAPRGARRHADRPSPPCLRRPRHRRCATARRQAPCGCRSRAGAWRRCGSSRRRCRRPQAARR